MNHDFRFFCKLFLSTFSLSAFTFGGGYVIIPLMRKKFVEQYNWISEEEMLDFTAISQSTPGAMAVNASLLVGYRLAGFFGAFVTLVATVLPPLLILSVVALFYQAFQDNRLVNLVLKGMGAGVAAVIADVVVTMARDVVSARNLFQIAVMLLTFVAVFVFEVNAILVVLVCAAVGILYALLLKGRKRGQEH